MTGYSAVDSYRDSQVTAHIFCGAKLWDADEGIKLRRDSTCETGVVWTFEKGLNLCEARAHVWSLIVGVQTMG